MGTGLALGIGIPFTRRMGAGIDAQAQAHYNRVIADGGLIPSGLVGVNNFFKTVKGIYGTADITTAISVGLDAQVLGYKLGAGGGTTAGQAAQKLYSCSGASGDVEQTTALSQPLLLVHSGANYYYNSGVAGNLLQSPNSAANQITGTVDFDFGFEILPSGNFTQGFGKVQANASGASYACFISSGGNVQYIDSLGSYTSVVNVSSFAPSAGNLFYVRLTLSGVTATCYTSLDGSNWTSRGTATVAALVTSNSSPITFSAGSFTGVQSKGYRLRIYNGLRNSGGTLAVDCNPSQYNAATSQTQWTSTTGEVWTINTGTAATGYKGVLVDRTIVQGDGVDDTLMSGTLTNYQYISRYMALTPYTMNNSGGRLIAGTGNGHLLYNFNTGLLRAFNGVDLDYSGEVVNRLQLFTANFNSSSSTILVNNANSVSGNTGTNISSILALFSSANPNQYSNCLINTIIQATSVNNSTQNTSIYNYIKSINNNAF